jgi:hypothetical protein
MMMRLTQDEVHALESIRNTPVLGFNPSTAPVTLKRLVEFSFVRHGIGDHLSITEAGRQVLFLQRCFEELSEFASNPKLVIQLECEEWLCKSGYVQRKSTKDQMHFFEFEITQKGQDWIAEFGSGNG